jgi:hypothetical protein
LTPTKTAASRAKSMRSTPRAAVQASPQPLSNSSMPTAAAHSRPRISGSSERDSSTRSSGVLGALPHGDAL